MVEGFEPALKVLGTYVLPLTLHPFAIRIICG